MAGSRFKARVMNVPPPPPVVASLPGTTVDVADSHAAKKEANTSFTEPDTSSTETEKATGTAFNTF